LVTMMSKYVDENQLDWDSKLSLLEMNINLMPDEAGKKAPFEVAYARKPRLRIDLWTPAHKIGLKPKLEKKWTGPMLVPMGQSGPHWSTSPG